MGQSEVKRSEQGTMGVLDAQTHPKYFRLVRNHQELIRVSEDLSLLPDHHTVMMKWGINIKHLFASTQT